MWKMYRMQETKLLIVPRGIEIIEQQELLHETYPLLIVPRGIEIVQRLCC